MLVHNTASIQYYDTIGICGRLERLEVQIDRDWPGNWRFCLLALLDNLRRKQLVDIAERLHVMWPSTPIGEIGGRHNDRGQRRT